MVSQEDSEKRKNRGKYKKRRPLGWSGKWLDEEITETGYSYGEFAEKCRLVNNGVIIDSGVFSKILREEEEYLRCKVVKVENGELQVNMAPDRILTMFCVLKEFGRVSTREKAYEYLKRLPIGFIDDGSWSYLDAKLKQLFPDQPVVVLGDGVADVQTVLQKFAQKTEELEEFARWIDDIIRTPEQLSELQLDEHARKLLEQARTLADLTQEKLREAFQ